MKRINVLEVLQLSRYRLGTCCRARSRLTKGPVILLVQGLNKKALQQLSMLERRIGKGEVSVVLIAIGRFCKLVRS